MLHSGRRTVLFIILFAGLTSAALAQSATPDPAVIARDADGRITVRARRVSQPIRIDGKLDDEAYATNAPFGDFVQQEPREGEPTTEKTDVWLFYDEKNIYVFTRCWDSH